MRRALPSVAVSQAKCTAEGQGADLMVLTRGKQQAPAKRNTPPDRVVDNWTAGGAISRSVSVEGHCEALDAPLNGVRVFTVMRHEKGSFSLHSIPNGEFLLAARAEGGGLGSFFRVYTELAVSGLTPGKGAPSYLGKIEKGGLYMKRSKSGKKGKSSQEAFVKRREDHMLTDPGWLLQLQQCNTKNRVQA